MTHRVIGDGQWHCGQWLPVGPMLHSCGRILQTYGAHTELTPTGLGISGATINLTVSHISAPRPVLRWRSVASMDIAAGF